MEKQRVIERVIEYLDGEIADVQAALLASGNGKPSDSHDELSARKQELERLKVLYRFLPRREYGRDDLIVPSSLVELDLDGRTAFYFLAPQGGGLITQIDGKPLQVITPNSPLGGALLGKKWGDTVEVEIRGKTRSYKIVSVI